MIAVTPLAAALLAALPLPQSAIALDAPIVRSGPVGDDVAAYVAISSASGDRLVGVHCDCSERAEIHRVDFEARRMDVAAQAEVPAGGTLEIRPKSEWHLMLIGLRTPIEPGASVRLTLRFEQAGERSLDFVATEDTAAAWAAARPMPIR